LFGADVGALHFRLVDQPAERRELGGVAIVVLRCVTLTWLNVPDARRTWC